MLNASGKAHKTDTSIRYHADDREAAIEALRKRAPKGSEFVAFVRGKRADFYLLRHDDDGTHSLVYISHYIGAIVGRRVYDGCNVTNGVEGCADYGEIIRDVALIVHGSTHAYTSQGIR